MKVISYPNEEKKAWYALISSSMYAISSTSQCKQGAWAFLEYLYADESQESNSRFIFPARRDAFEAFIRDVDSLNWIMGENGEKLSYTEEDIRTISEMVENMYYDGSTGASTIRNIIEEEREAFFRNDRSAGDTASIIQNRVQLYLDELP